MEIDDFKIRSREVGKFAHPGASHFRHAMDLALGIAEQLGERPCPPARVLDLGCGIGDTVRELVEVGFDARGVDIGEWWGADHDAYWHDTPIPEEAIRGHLSVVSEANYRLPYPDDYFDFAMSNQVFEHVFNYVDVFRELGRVLKPGALSVHVFPGRGTPFEPHLGIPVTALAKTPAWLAVWSLIQRRNRSSWRDEYAFLRDSMRSNNYPSRRHLSKAARQAGVRLEFHERAYIEASDGSRPQRLLRGAQRAGLGWAVAPVLARVCQRAMILRPR